MNILGNKYPSFMYIVYLIIRQLDWARRGNRFRDRNTVQLYSIPFPPYPPLSMPAFSPARFTPIIPPPKINTIN